MDLDPRQRLRLGVSACLLGEAVRYDGTDRRCAVLTDRLGPVVDWVAVCPELEAGLGVPREPIQLEGDPSDPRVRGVNSRTDHTARLRGWAEEHLRTLDPSDLDGFVLKARSPSCEPEGVDVHAEAGIAGRAPGVFAAALALRDPLLPLCTEEDLEDPVRRRHFLERARARHGCRDAKGESVGAAHVGGRETMDGLIRSHELLLVAREQDPERPRGLVGDERGRDLQRAMCAECTAAGHARALRWGLSRLDALGEPSRWALAVFARDVELGRLDPEVGRQLLRALAHTVDDRWLRSQRYLDPVPRRWREDATVAARSAAAGCDEERDPDAAAPTQRQDV